MTRLLAAASAALLAPAAVRAELVLTVVQVGPNVMVFGSGTVNTAGLTFDGSGFAPALLSPSDGLLTTGPVGPRAVDRYTGLAGPASFGGAVPRPAAAGHGDRVVLFAAAGQLWLPEGYTSGTALDTTSNYGNRTFAGLGLTPGTYTYTWGAGPTADRLVLQIGPVAVPEPGSLGLALSAAVPVLAGWRLRRRRTV